MSDDPLSPRRGTLPIKRTFPKLGRLYVASGTKDPELLGRLNSMLTTLYESRRDIIRALLARRLTVLEVWDRFRVGNLGDLPLSAEMMMPLAESMEAWKDRLKNRKGEPASLKHKEGIQLSINHLTRHGATVGALPDALAACKDELLPAKKRTYQLRRVHALGFLRDLKGIGRHHQLYFDVANVADVQVKASRQKGMSIAAFRERIKPLDQRTTAEAWAMAGTGMRPGEYLAHHFTVRPDRVEVRGTKNDSAVRVTLHVAPVQGPFRQYRAMWQALNAVGLRPHTLRRCFSHWCEEAGIPLTRIKAYMGHSQRSGGAGITGSYLEVDVLPYLADDTAKIKAYIGPVEIGIRLEKRA